LNLANALSEVHLFSESIKHFEYALVLQPSFVEVRANLERNRETVCDWEGHGERFQRLRRDVEAQLERGQASVVRPWHALAYPWPPSLLLRMARSFADKTLHDVSLQGLAASSAAPPPPAAARRLVVAYVSYCFSSHPTTYLLSSVFRLHNRKRVHVHCYALNARDDSPARAAVEADCESFHTVDTVATGTIAGHVNRNHVHVSINLDGWTSMGRTNEIFALTPAPVQVQYMGYPGSLAAPYIPWLLTDRVISPPEAQHEYSEKLLLHSRGYYINDYARLFPSHPKPPPRAQRDLSAARARVGFSRKGPVVVNLNNLYKVSGIGCGFWRCAFVSLARSLSRARTRSLFLSLSPDPSHPNPLACFGACI
jgi:protein O-GlcNAc transferase